MKTTCSVIQDLLPLYCDDACSAESRRLVEEHLKECDDCRETYQLMQAALPPAPPTPSSRPRRRRHRRGKSRAAPHFSRAVWWYWRA